MMESFVLYNAAGEPIRGVVRRQGAGSSGPVVVICHGFKGFMNWGFHPYLGERLAEAGFTAVHFNFSGSGVGAEGDSFTELEKFARNTFSQELADVRVVLDAIGARMLPGAAAFDVHRVALLGHSLGGAIGILAAAENPRIRALITWAAPSSLQWYPELRAEWRERGFLSVRNARTGQDMRIDVSLLDDMVQHAGRLDVKAAMRRLTIPVLVVHGDGDESVPVAAAHALARAGQSTTVTLDIIAGTGHTLGGVHPLGEPPAVLRQVVDGTARWLLEHV